MMTEFAWDNPFNFDAWDEWIDPMYAKTAEDFDRAGFMFLPEIADMDTYAEAHLLPVYRQALSEAIESGHVPLNRTTADVPHPTAARLTSCRIKRLESTRRDGEEAGSGVFNLDAVIVAEIDIFQAEHPIGDALSARNTTVARNASVARDTVLARNATPVRNATPTRNASAARNATPARMGAYRDLVESGVPYRTSHVRQWYRLRGYHDLRGWKTDPVQSIMIYDKKDKRKERGLSDSLVPIIPSADMEQEAAELLRRNKMGDAVDKFCRVDAKTLATNMGLAVEDVWLTKEHRIRGELFLHEATVKYYKADGTEDYMKVKAGTILYDSVACGTPERIEETIIHECVHKDEHFLFYKLQREYNDNINFLACMDNRYADDTPEDAYEQWLGDETYEGFDFPADERRKRTPVEWVEWQARQLTPRVKMPGPQTKARIRSLIDQYGRYPHNTVAELYARIIPKLAKIYNVTWSMAKIRMIELGFDEARGARNYIDGKYVPPYTTSTGKFNAGTTYDVSRDDLNRLYEKDTLFRAIADGRGFVYAESHYCIDDPRFVWADGNGHHLTDEARQNIDRCCMLFFLNKKSRQSRYDKEALHNDDWKNDPVAVAIAALPLDAFMDPGAYKAKLVADLPLSFGETLKYHREKEGLTQEELAERLGVNRVTISRYETAKKPSITKQMIARIGLEFQLQGEYTEDMMDKAGLPLDLKDEKDNALRFVIYYMFAAGVENGNRFLLSHNCLPLMGRKGEVA